MLAFQVDAAAMGAPIPTQVSVHADVLVVRSTPSASGTALARIRIGTRLFERGRENGWVEVQHGDLHGWVNGEFVRSEPPDGEALLREAAAALDPHVALRLTQRAVALDGSDRARWELLREVAAHAGRPDEVERSERTLQGEELTYFARCHGGRADLVAQYAPGDGFRSWVATGESPPTVEALNAMRAAVASMTWYRGAAGEAVVVSGSPFWHAVERPLWNYRPGEDTGTDRGEVLELGRCSPSEHDELLSTNPFLVGLPRAPMNLDRTQQLLPILPALGDEPILGLALTEPISGWPIIEAQVTRTTAFSSCGEGHWDDAAKTYLLDGDGTVRWSLGDKPGDPPDAGRSHWFSLSVGGAERALVWHESSWGPSGAGATLTMIDLEAPPESITVPLTAFGC